MILRFEFDLSGAFDITAFFLDFWAKKSGVKYAIEFTKNKISLFVDGDEKMLDEFSSKYLTMVPHSIFLRDSKVEICEQMPETSKLDFDFALNLLTPNSLKTKTNEFGFSADQIWVQKAANALKNGESIEYNEHIFSEFTDFDCDFLLPIDISLLAKIFVCDEKSLIALASFEKPVVELRTNGVFRATHEFAPLFFKAKLAWNQDIFELCSYLEGMNFLKVKSKKPQFEIKILDDSLIIASGTDFVSKKDREFIENKQDKNQALFVLKLKELDLLDKTCAQIFLSERNDDFIVVYKQGSEFELLQIKIPNSFDEIYDAIRIYNGGNELLAKFETKFGLIKGEIKLKNNFYSIFEIIRQICGFKHDILELANDFGGVKGIRIDFKMSNQKEFDVILAIKSAMNFALAGTDAKNISFGLVENLSLFLSDLGDAIKDELECDEFVLCGSLFRCKSLANLALKYSNSNFKTRFSERYPLEIS